MDKDRHIAGSLQLASLMDRTLFIFRRHLYSFLAISLVTYGSLALIMAFLYFSGIIDPIWEIEVNHREIPWSIVVMMMFFFLPTIWSDLAIQYFLSSLVREMPISWWKAVRLSLTPKLLGYFVMKSIGMVLVVLVSAFSGLFVLIPFVGFFVFIYCATSSFVMFVSMGPSVIVEERRGVFGTLGRNVALFFSGFGAASLGSAAGFLFMVGFLMSLMSLVGGFSGTVAAILFGRTDYFLSDTDVAVFFLNLGVLFVPLVIALTYVPLSGIYYGVMYYAIRSKESGWDLENEVILFDRETAPKEAPQAPSDPPIG